MGTETQIHPTAVIHQGAEIGAGCKIDPYAVIGPNVVLGENCWVGPHAVVEGHTVVGAGNKIFQFASVGSIPQDLKFHGEPSRLEVGDKNIIREFVTLQPGTEGGGMLTKIGSKNLFMANAHVGHDSFIGDSCVFANSSAVAGHVTIGSGVIVGGLVGIHQFVRIGDLVMLAAGSMVSKDIPHFCMAQGDRAQLVGINRVGMERSGLSKDDQSAVKKAYKTLFVSADNGTFANRVELARKECEGNAQVERMLSFIQEAKRGVPRHRGGEGD